MGCAGEGGGGREEEEEVVVVVKAGSGAWGGGCGLWDSRWVGQPKHKEHAGHNKPPGHKKRWSIHIHTTPMHMYAPSARRCPPPPKTHLCCGVPWECVHEFDCYALPVSHEYRGSQGGHRGLGGERKGGAATVPGTRT